MRTFSRRTALHAALAIGLLLGVAPAVAESSPQIINIPISRPGDPISLEIGIISAHIEVIGEDRDDAEFEVTVANSGRKIVTPSGTKELSNAGYSLEVDEDDNEISFETDWRNNHVKVIARIPKRADLDLSTNNDGVIIVRNITGNLELSNINGPVTATGISGSVIAESVNDAVDLSFVAIDDVNPSSLESINGTLTLRLPANAGAQIHLDTSRGEIISDFEVDVLPSTPKVQRRDAHGGVEVRVESIIIANINGGGPTFRMKTMNGDINILKAK